jgi:peptide/nickel transport system ATP-binding protein
VALPRGSERRFRVGAVDLELAPNEILCVVGESGSGKSLTARGVMGLLPGPHVRIEKSGIRFGEEDLAKASEARL